MPTVVTGGQILPGGIPKNRWYNDLGLLQGATADKILSAFLASQSGGFGRQAQPVSAQSPGTFNFPQGSSSPGEQEQIKRLGGVPTQQGFMSKASYGGTGGATFQPDTRWGFGSNYDSLIKQQQLARLQQQSQMENDVIAQAMRQQQLVALQQANDPSMRNIERRTAETKLGQAKFEMDPNNPDNILKSAQADYFRNAIPPVSSADPASSLGLTPDEIISLDELATSGDPEAERLIQQMRDQGLL